MKPNAIVEKKIKISLSFHTTLGNIKNENFTTKNLYISRP